MLNDQDLQNTGKAEKTTSCTEEYDFPYLRLGAGVQSSALLVLSCTDDRVPKPDVAIFADTGDEPPWVYEYLDALTDWAKPHGVEVVKAQKGILSESFIKNRDEGKRFVSVPVFTAKPDGSRRGMLRRQCTNEFKIQPITQEVRKILGYGYRRRVKEKVRAMLGITTDEVQRMKPSLFKWCTNVYPLVDLDFHRNDCYEVLEKAGLPEPQKSACVYCPYHSDDYWHWLKTTHPDQFQRAVDFDYSVRDMSKGGGQLPAYVHSSCIPLDQVNFKQSDNTQLDMWAECEGMRGV